MLVDVDARHRFTRSGQVPRRPRVPAMPNDQFAIFAAATAAVTTAYVLGAMTLSLGAQIAREVVSSSNALVNGGTIALFAVASALATIPARRLTPRRVVLVGAAIAISSSGVPTMSVYLRSLILYTIAQAGSGMADSLFLLTGRNACYDHRPA